MKVLAAPKVLGVVFIVLLLLGVWVTYGIFTKKFASYDEVTLQTSKIGLQLPSRADVKIRGVIVGEVLGFDTTADGANITLGIYPDKIHTIPADVTGEILPKTLFGEKYVSLEVPEGAQTGGSGPVEPIKPGATIEKTEVSIEVQKVLADLYPLLRTVQPADLNMTLNAMATALEGRGQEIGENLVTVDNYLKRLNPQIPQIVEDLRLTAKVSNVYADALPQIAQILRDTIKTTGTLKGREAKLKALFNDVSAFADTTREFLRDNGDNLIRLSKIGQKQLTLFARYAPEYPCLLKGIVGAGKLQAEAFRGFVLHIVLETLPNQPRGYTPADAPRNADTRGPYCGRLPNPPWNQSNPVRHQPNFNDGVDQPTGKGTDRTTLGYWSGTGAGYNGSVGETQLLKNLLAPAYGTSAAEVPDIGVLLVSPMARGAKVGYR
jgi:phospholipid/cholesterol/gamma-HCH transport system substrate-binding protein